MNCSDDDDNELRRNELSFPRPAALPYVIPVDKKEGGRISEEWTAERMLSHLRP